MRHVGSSQLSDLAAKAAAQPEWYYPAAFEFVGGEWLRPPSAVVDPSDGLPFARWFIGAETNVAWAAVHRWQGVDRTAVIWHSEDDESIELTFDDLADQVMRVDAGLRGLGVSKGDRVAMHLPPIPEAIVLMLALGRIGAIGVPVFSGFGVDPLRERLQLSQAKVLVTADGFLRRGRRVAMLPTALAAAADCDSVSAVVSVSRLGEVLPDSPGLHRWSDLIAGPPQVTWDAHAADDPWLIMYTSGSTGRPKGAVLTQGGFPASLMVELAFQADVRPGDRYCWPADMGWMAGPAYTTVPLMLGACVVIYEGTPTYPSPDRLWDLVDRYQITQLGFGPTLARQLAEAGAEWVEPHLLTSLRTIPSGGEPWTLSAWQWVHRHIGRGRAPIINWCGGTEIGGSMVSGFPNVATEAMRFSGPVLGVDVDVVDAEGTAVLDIEGELVMRRTTPGVTRGFWQEPDRYFETYWSKIEGLWVHGDRALHHADGSFSVIGRSDDILKIAGKRIGPSELESIALEVPGVTHAAAVGVFDESKGESVVIVISSVTSAGAVADVEHAVADRIATRFGKPLRPRAVLTVQELPRTRSGKTHRRFLRSWLNGVEPEDQMSLENPHVRGDVLRATYAAGLLQADGSSAAFQSRP